MSSRTAYRLLFALSILLLPTSCVPILTACNAFGMGLAFKAGFDVQNLLDVPIEVTPVGAVGSEGARHPLPMLLPGAAYADHWRNRRFPVAPGETVRLYYDFDDIQFSELVVRAPGWEKMLVVDPNPTERQYRAMRGKQFSITLDQLVPVTAPVAAAAAAPDRMFVWWGLNALGVFSLALFFFSRKRLRRFSTTPQLEAAPRD